MSEGGVLAPGAASGAVRDVPVTVVIPVKNEAANLPRCLGALGRFAHLVVADSGSTDETPEIARESGATYLNFEWNGQFPKKRNWVLRTHAFETNWVLFLDADEFVSNAFVDAVKAAVADTPHDAFWLNYTNYFQGKRLKHGLPQRKLALLRVGAGEYERIDEDGWTKLDMEVHEHPIVAGTTGEIDLEIEHQDYRGLARFIDRHLDYAQWEAQRVRALGDLSGPNASHLTNRQRFKYRNLPRWWYAQFYFYYVYILRLGWLDGAAGYNYAFHKYWYFRTIRELIQEDAAPPAPAKPAASHGSVSDTAPKSAPKSAAEPSI
ncbi:MAG: glycosyltransferase family 2 protein [Pseudomonadota bacterium]